MVKRTNSIYGRIDPGWYEGSDDGKDVVRRPGDDERQQDGAQCLCRLPVLLLLLTLFLRRPRTVCQPIVDAFLERLS